MTDDQTHVLYTYQTVAGQLVCHAYGPTSEQNARDTGANLQASAASASEPVLSWMALPLEAMPV